MGPKQLPPLVTRMHGLRSGEPAFLSEGSVIECLLRTDTHSSPRLPLLAFVNEHETHSDHKRKMVLFLDTRSRQSLQNHFINNILEPVRKYILQTVIKIVYFGKWILNFHLSPSETFPQMQCMFLLPRLNDYDGLKWW